MERLISSYRKSRAAITIKPNFFCFIVSRGFLPQLKMFFCSLDHLLHWKLFAKFLSCAVQSIIMHLNSVWIKSPRNYFYLGKTVGNVCWMCRIMSLIYFALVSKNLARQYFIFSLKSISQKFEQFLTFLQRNPSHIIVKSASFCLSPKAAICMHSSQPVMHFNGQKNWNDEIYFHWTAARVPLNSNIAQSLICKFGISKIRLQKNLFLLAT